MNSVKCKRMHGAASPLCWDYFEDVKFQGQITVKFKEVIFWWSHQEKSCGRCWMNPALNCADF